MKSQAILNFLDQFSEKNFGRKRSECIVNNICVQCGAKVNDLKGVYAEEYLLSGFCKQCQDETFHGA